MSSESTLTKAIKKHFAPLAQKKEKTMTKFEINKTYKRIDGITPDLRITVNELTQDGKANGHNAIDESGMGIQSMTPDIWAEA